MWRRGRAAQEVCGCALGTGTASREGLQGPTGGTVACVEQLCVCGGVAMVQGLAGPGLYSEWDMYERKP